MEEMKDRMEVMDNGDIKAIVTYPQRDVEVKVKGKPFVIGVQPAYDVVNITHKDRLKDLLAFLYEQREMLSDRLKQAKDVIERTEYASSDALAEAINKVDPEKLKNKHFKELNDIANDVKLNNDAKMRLPLIQKNVDKISEQIDFIEKNNK